MRHKNIHILCFIIISLFFCARVSAQERSGESIGSQSQRFEEETKEKQKELQAKKVKPPEIKIEEEKEKPAYPAVSFILKDVKITGSTVFDKNDFYPLYKDYLNKKVNFDDLEVIIERIKAKYKQKGYLTTAVYIPEQEFKDGVIEIAVAEGKMGNLRIEDNKYFAASLIRDYIHSKKNEILDIGQLQKDILRLNKNPDLEITSVISAGELPQTSDITLKVKEKFPYHFGASFDKQGTRLTGKYRGGFSLRSSNATGNFDSLFLNSIFSYNSFGQSLLYAAPIDTYGTKLGFDFTYFKMKLGKEFKSFNIKGNTQIYTPYMSWEMFLREDLEVNAKTGLEIKCIEKTLDGEPTTNDNLRLPFFAFDFTKTDSFLGGGQTSFIPRFVFSLKDALGASTRNHLSASRPGGDGFFFKYEQTIQRVQKMPWESYIQARCNFQLPTRTLPSSEQFQIGGANSIRGYPEGDYLADLGGSLNLEWVFPSYFIPKNWRLAKSKTPLYKQIEPVFFIDVGGGALRKVLPGERENKFLAGVGGGLRLHLIKNSYLSLSWAAPVGDDPVPGAGPSTFNINFQYEI